MPIGLGARRRTRRRASARLLGWTASWLYRLMANVLSHLLMSHVHEPCSNLNLLLEVGIVGGSCRTLSGADDLGVWRVWQSIIAAPVSLPSTVAGALLFAHCLAAHGRAAGKLFQSRAFVGQLSISRTIPRSRSL